MGRRVGGAFVQAHDDVRAQGLLDLDGFLRAEKMPGAVQVRLKLHPLPGNLGQRIQAEDLKPAAIGEQGAVPMHERVQPAETPDPFVAGAQVQVIGVGQNDLGAQALQLFRGHRLDCGLGAHGHEGRRLKGAMRRVADSQPRLRF